ncbi:MAG: HAMP domain-containing protein [Rhizobiaceae bacterium]
MTNRSVTSKPSTQISLTAAVFGFVVLAALVTAFAAFLFIRQQLAVQGEAALAQAVHVRAQGAEHSLARALHQKWEDTRIIARDLAFQHPASLRAALDLVVGDGSRVSWAGYARVDGTVASASGGLLVGQDVSARPWFQEGLEDDFAGDVHEALLLADLLGPLPDGSPRRFLDFATPVVDANDRVAGVLALHIDFGWAERFLASTAEALQLELFLLNQAGEVIIATDGGDHSGLELASIRSARLGVQSTQLETWPDGERYFTTVVPQVAYEDLPLFGWRLLARIDGQAVAEHTRALLIRGAFSIVVLWIALLAMTIVFVLYFVRPFGRIADNADAIAHGHDAYPIELRRTSEMEKLSSALARLQARIRK